MKQFKDIEIGQSFIKNGNICTKSSSKTAIIVQYLKTFYFSQTDLVEAI